MPHVRELTVLLWMALGSAGTDDVAPMLLVQTFPECGGDLSELEHAVVQLHRLVGEMGARHALFEVRKAFLDCAHGAGETKAVRLAMEKLILPELGHIVGELKK